MKPCKKGEVSPRWSARAHKRIVEALRRGDGEAAHDALAHQEEYFDQDYPFGKLDFDDLQAEQSYHRVSAYGRSKLSNLLFTYELQRRFRRAGC